MTAFAVHLQNIYCGFGASDMGRRGFGNLNAFERLVVDGAGGLKTASSIELISIVSIAGPTISQTACRSGLAHEAYKYRMATDASLGTDWIKIQRPSDVHST